MRSALPCVLVHALLPEGSGKHGRPSWMLPRVVLDASGSAVAIVSAVCRARISVESSKVQNFVRVWLPSAAACSSARRCAT